MNTATGTFEVTMEPAEETAAEGVTLGRMTLAKSFVGDLASRSDGQMPTAMSPVKGSAGYVAAERFAGTLSGRQGSFAMTHRGVMSASGQDLVIGIVPDTGTGDLAGITGTMTIDVRDGQHFYALDYASSD